MIVVADTSPICYLILIDEIQLLGALFGTVHVPEAVAAELAHTAVPAPVAQFLREPPAWIEVQEIGAEEVPPVLTSLDDGEREAILLAQRLKADLLIADDKAARKTAESLGLRVTGTLGVLEAATRRGLLDLPRAVDRLRKTNFRVSPALLRSLLERNR